MRKTSILVVLGVALIMLSVPFVSAETQIQTIHKDFKLPDNLSSIPNWLKIYGNPILNSNKKLEFINSGGGNYGDSFVWGLFGDNATGFSINLQKTNLQFSRITNFKIMLNATYTYSHPLLTQKITYPATLIRIEIFNNTEKYSRYFDSAHMGIFTMTNSPDEVVKNPNKLENLYLMGEITCEYSKEKNGYTIMPKYSTINNIGLADDNLGVLNNSKYFNYTQIYYTFNVTLTYYANNNSLLNNRFGISGISILKIVRYNGDILEKKSVISPHIFPDNITYSKFGMRVVYYDAFSGNTPQRKVTINAFDLSISGIRYNTGGNSTGNGGNSTGNSGNNNNENNTNPIIGSKVQPYYPLTYNMGIILGIVIITMVIATDIYIHKKFP